VVELKVDEGILIRRIESRIAETRARGEPLRKDDDPEVLKTRLDAYRRQTAPLIEHYREKGMLRAVDGMATPDEVAAAIAWIFSRPSAKGAKDQKTNKKAAKAASKPIKLAPAKAKSKAQSRSKKTARQPAAAKKAKKPVARKAAKARKRTVRKAARRKAGRR
jgi:adenylate kinase